METDKATVTFESQDEGYLAKILVGTGEIKVGQPIMVTVDDQASVAAFSTYSVIATTAPVSPAKSTPAAPPVSPAAVPSPVPSASKTSSQSISTTTPLTQGK